MRKATLEDLELELWLRKRNSGYIIWTTKDAYQRYEHQPFSQYF